MHPSSLTLRRDKACGNVGFCDEYDAGSVFTKVTTDKVYLSIKPAQRGGRDTLNPAKQELGARLPTMCHRLVPPSPKATAEGLIFHKKTGV